MVEFKERLAHAMSIAGVNESTLASRLGITYQAVKKQLKEGTKDGFSGPNTVRAARFLGVDAYWLATGEGPTPVASENLNADLPLIQRIEGALRVLSESASSGLTCTVLPVVDFQGMDMSHKNESLTGRVNQWLTAPGRFSEFSKITSMPDDSMHPEIHQGEYLALECSESVQPEAGDTVLIGNDAGGLWLRKYRPQTRGGFHAVAANEDYPTLQSEDDGVRVLAVMVGHWRGRRAKKH